jgi:hypothetical protein
VSAPFSNTNVAAPVARQLELWTEPRRCVDSVEAPSGSETLEYYLGAHRAHWLRECTWPLFISHRVLRGRKSLPRARTRWALDSGGFTELNLHGERRTSARDYVAQVRRYSAEIGNLQFASQQDWMCETSVLAKTGLSVTVHQEKTIDNFIELMMLAPELPWMPVLQGWCVRDYHEHIERWEARGIALKQRPRVGVGSICRRKCDVVLKRILSEVAGYGLRLHAFGLKTSGLRSAGGHLVSADSMAWSYAARRENRDCGPLLARQRTGGQNRLESAIGWFEQRIEPIIRAGFCEHTGFSRLLTRPRERGRKGLAALDSGERALGTFDAELSGEQALVA